MLRSHHVEDENINIASKADKRLSYDQSRSLIQNLERTKKARSQNG